MLFFEELFTLVLEELWRCIRITQVSSFRPETISQTPIAITHPISKIITPWIKLETSRLLRLRFKLRESLKSRA